MIIVHIPERTATPLHGLVRPRGRVLYDSDPDAHACNLLLDLCDGLLDLHKGRGVGDGAFVFVFGAPHVIQLLRDGAKHRGELGDGAVALATPTLCLLKLLARRAVLMDERVEVVLDEALPGGYFVHRLGHVLLQVVQLPLALGQSVLDGGQVPVDAT